MTTNELKTCVAKQRRRLKENNGYAVAFGDGGPVNMDMIDALVAAIEAQDRRIADLERQLAAHPS